MTVFLVVFGATLLGFSSANTFVDGAYRTVVLAGLSFLIYAVN